jgi:hypothetical protein
MFILMLFVVFGLVIFGMSFVVKVINAVRYDCTVSVLSHMIIIAACVTFLVLYFNG